MTDHQLAGTQRVVVLQTAGQVRHYSEHKRQENDLVIPIGPEARYHAENNGWKTCNLGSLWSSKDYEQAKDESQARIDALIDALDVYSRGWNPDLALEIGHYYAFQLWIIVGQIHYNYFIARSIVKRLQPDRVLVYTKDIDQPFLELRPDPDRVFADVVSRSGCLKAENLEIREISEQIEAHTGKEKILNSLPQMLAIRLREFRSRWGIRNSRRSAYRLLMVGGAYDWAKISRYEAFRSVFSIHVMPRLVAGKEGSPPKELVGILSSSVAFAERPVFDIERLASAMYADMVLYEERNEEIRNKLKRYDALVTGVFTYPWENYLAHTAAKIGKPVVAWQHGEKGQYQDVTGQYTELLYATDYLAYGPSVSDQYRSWVGKARLLNVETVGSLTKKVAWRGGTRIIYATGKWFKTAVPFPVPPDPDLRLSRAHKTILDYLDTVAVDHPVVLKANNTPRFNGIPDQYKNLRVAYTPPFIALLQTARVVILDTPGTTLVESCSTKVPIFVLGGRAEYFPDFLGKIKRRVVWCDTPEELVLKLESYLRTGMYEGDVNDDTYYSESCAAPEPDEVVLRVKKGLLNAINRSRNANKQ